jgi:FkbM family methyltransferase
MGTVVNAVRPAPSWVRALGSVVRRLPRGRYQVVASIRSASAPFVSALATDLGAPRFACDLSDEIAREVCLTGYYEPPVTRLIHRRLRQGGTMVDVGANWGYFSLLAASAVGANGRVVSLEPDPRQFATLESNVRLNAFTQIAPLRQAAAAAAGDATLLGYVDDAGNRGVSRLGTQVSNGPTFDVKCVAIDDVVAGLPHVDVIKVDVEGAELGVLRGMRDGLSAHKYRSVLLELHPDWLAARGDSPDACVALLLDAGYTAWTIDQSPRAYRRAVDPGVRSEDMLQPLASWRAQPWPHLLWLAPGAGLA